MSGYAIFAIKKSPTLISTTINHYLNGPPYPSWDLKFHLVHKILQLLLTNINLTIEQVQEFSIRPIPAPAGITISEFKIDNKYRHEAQIYLDRILKPYEHVLDTEWKDLKEDGIGFEWVQVPDDGLKKRKVKKTILYLHGGAYIMCGKGAYRNLTGNLAKGANVFGK